MNPWSLIVQGKPKVDYFDMFEQTEPWNKCGFEWYTDIQSFATSDIWSAPNPIHSIIYKFYINCKSGPRTKSKNLNVLHALNITQYTKWTQHSYTKYWPGNSLNLR